MCDHKRFCAVVPVVYQGRCLAAVKLASPVSMGEEEFERHVELMDLLVRDFSLSQADFLACVLRDTVAAAGPDPSTPGVPPELGAWKGAGTHPQILRALEHIDEHLCDPKLTVARIARELDIHPYYLSHLFADQVGQRMSRLIAAKRVELAKTLLATTHWQIKRIAHETGHANPNWFSHVFSIHTGVTPSAYRRRTRVPSRGASTQ
jgi:AraC-like DNA-binding protein